MGFVLLVLALLPGATAQAGAGEAPPALNTVCVVMEDEPVDPKFTITFEGQRIGFCCKMCRKEFLENPAEFRGALPAAAGGASAVAMPAAPAPPAWTAAAGAFHPLVVHFPIALILAAALAEFLAMRSGKDSDRGRLRGIARYCLVLGTAGAVLAATLGWLAGLGSHPDWMTEPLFRHRWLGIATTALAIGSLLAARGALGGQRSETVHRVLLFSAAALIGVAGYYGGILAFGPDHLPF